MINELKQIDKASTVVAVLLFVSRHMGAMAVADVVVETAWTPTESRVLYEVSPDEDVAQPCIVRMLDGTLVALVQKKRGQSIFIRSQDGGETWSDPYRSELPGGVGGIGTLGVRRDGRLVAVLEKSTEVLHSPSVKRLTVKLPDGRECEKYAGYRYSSEMRLAHSSDQGRTWTLDSSVDYSPLVAAWVWVGGRILELDDGTLVVPLAGYLSKQDMSGIFLSSGVLRSTDEGATWSWSIIGRGSQSDWLIFSEPAIAKLHNGTLVALMRVDDRVKKSIPGDPRGSRTGLHRSHSTDGGRTWSTPRECLAGTHCSVAQLADGVLLCGYHRAPRLALSADEGAHWYANMLWVTDKPRSNWGWYTSVEMVNETAAICIIGEYSAKNIIRFCMLRRQP